jgi:phosphoglycolate phosphatase
MPYAYLLWDWNGTLLDDAGVCVTIINALLARRGLPQVDAARYQAEFTFPVRDYYRRVGFDFARDPFETLAQEFVAAYDVQRFACALQPAVHQALGAAAARGLPQAILSAYEQGRLEELTRHAGVAHYFTCLAGLDHYYADGKIARGRELLAALPCPPAHVLLIGDTLHDLEVAEALGMDCLLVPGGHQSLARLQASGARVLPSLAAVAAWLGYPEGESA